MPRITKKKLEQLQRKLVTDTAIAKFLGISQPSIHYLRKVYGIPSRFSGITDRNKQIGYLYSQGFTADAIADKFGLCAGRVYQIANDGGVHKRKRKRTISKHYETILSLHEQGLPGTAIAEHIGICFNYVYRVIRVARAKGHVPHLVEQA